MKDTTHKRDKEQHLHFDLQYFEVGNQGQRLTRGENLCFDTSR